MTTIKKQFITVSIRNIIKKCCTSLCVFKFKFMVPWPPNHINMELSNTELYVHKSCFVSHIIIAILQSIERVKPT